MFVLSRVSQAQEGLLESCSSASGLTISEINALFSILMISINCSQKPQFWWSDKVMGKTATTRKYKNLSKVSRGYNSAWKGRCDEVTITCHTSWKEKIYSWIGFYISCNILIFMFFHVWEFLCFSSVYSYLMGKSNLLKTEATRLVYYYVKAN
jgi:hypothetical protein